MWGAYYYKVTDFWTPAVAWVPRWYAANLYPTLFDQSSTPSTSGFTITRTWTAPVTGAIPSSWNLTSHTPTTTGSFLQGVFEALTYEKQRVFLGLTTNFLVCSKYLDPSEPSWSWCVDHFETVQYLEILVAGVWTEVSRALGVNDMLVRGDRSWVGSGNRALVFGVDLQQQTTQQRVDNWQFVSSASTWSSGEVLYYEHPVSRTWIPLHPLSVRGDGLLHFTHSATGWVRSHYTPAVSALTTLRVRVNQTTEYDARRVDLWNSVDEKALISGLTRKEQEFNTPLVQAMLVTNWFGGQTLSGLRDALSGHLRLGQLATYNVATNSTLVFPASSTGCTVRDFPQYTYVSEVLQPEPNNYWEWRTAYSVPDTGCILLNQRKIDHSSLTSSGTLTLDTLVDNKTHHPVAYWRTAQYTTTASSLTFTSNTPTTIPDVTVYFASKVRVNIPSNFSARHSFLRKSPSLRWTSSEEVIETGVRGLASFEQ